MESNSIDFCKKYRPRKFGEVLGNKDAIQYLKNSASTGRIPRKLFLHGEKGSGKGTLAHIYTKSLTCENFQGEPCGECNSCKSLEANYPLGSALSSVTLWDCTGIDEKRLDEIIRRYFGYLCGNRIEKNIFIWDEFHRIRDRGQDKLLNSQKETDIFIFTLIDLSVVESALLQRAVVFKTERPEMEEIISWLHRICKLEGIIVQEDDALMRLAKEADRLPRECLKVLETLAVYGEPLTVDLIRKMFRNRRSVRNED